MNCWRNLYNVLFKTTIYECISGVLKMKLDEILRKLLFETEIFEAFQK